MGRRTVYSFLCISWTGRARITEPGEKGAAVDHPLQRPAAATKRGREQGTILTSEIPQHIRFLLQIGITDRAHFPLEILTEIFEDSFIGRTNGQIE